MRKIARLRSLLARERLARQHRTEVTRLAARTSGEISRRGVAEVIAAGAGAIFDAGWAMVAFVGDDDVIHFVHGPGVPPEIVHDWATAPIETEIPIAAVLRGETDRVALTSREDFLAWPVVLAEADRADIGSFFVEAVPGPGRPHAVVALAWPDAHELDEGAQELLDELVDVATPAFDRAVFTEADHDIATTLREWLLPRDLAEIEGLEVATMYEAGHAAMQVGGDWYDVIRLDDERAAIVVGDVVGHDVRAVAEMAQVRHVLASHLIVTGDPATSLTLTDQYLHQRIADTMATAVVVIVDRAGRSVEIASAGHLPPVLAQVGVPSTVLQCGLGPPIGSGLSGYRCSRHDVPPGAMCVAMTDGVIELRGETIDASLDAFRMALDAHLAECVAAGAQRSSIGAVIDLLRRRLDHTGRTDDAAAVVFRVTPDHP